MHYPRFGIFFLFEKEKQTRGFTPKPRQRRAASHSLQLSVGSSAHSPANALELERVRARASCFASRSLTLPSWFLPLRRGYWKLDYKSRLGHLLLLCKSQGNGFAFICLNLLKASPLADSRKGCPYKRSVIDSSRILCRSRGSGVSRSPHHTRQ